MLSDRYPQLWSWLQLLSSLVLGTLLWLLGSLLVVTLPAATAGLYGVVQEGSKLLDFNLLGVFWETLRRRWRQATALWLLTVVAGALLGFDIWFFAGRAGWLQAMTGVALAMALLLLMWSQYLWPLLVRTDWGIWRLAKTAALLAVAHLMHSLAMAAATVAVVLAIVHWPILFFLGGPAVIALVGCYGTGLVLRRYLDKPEGP